MEITKTITATAKTCAFCASDVRNKQDVETLLKNVCLELTLVMDSFKSESICAHRILFKNEPNPETNPDGTIFHFEVEGFCQ